MCICYEVVDIYCLSLVIMFWLISTFAISLFFRSHVKMPEAIYNAYLQKEPLTGTNLKLMKLNDTAISDIVQWGNMLIFDYLTGNYDR